jgi:hypothetical protein
MAVDEGIFVFLDTLEVARVVPFDARRLSGGSWLEPGDTFGMIGRGHRPRSHSQVNGDTMPVTPTGCATSTASRVLGQLGRGRFTVDTSHGRPKAREFHRQPPLCSMILPPSSVCRLAGVLGVHELLRSCWRWAR